jgi:FixJ family two-component response regulator
MGTDMTDARAKDIYIVDDDPGIRDALSLIFRNETFDVTSFSNGASFINAARRHAPACIILDVHMPDRSGLDILKELNAQNYATPIFIISGHGDIPMAVEAVKNGAFDFIEKPFDADTVVGRVREAITAVQHHKPSTDFSFPGAELLTPRERDVLTRIAGGASNKEAGRELGISPRTIEVHRARIMEKVGAKNAADLVRIVLSANR